MLMRDTNVTQSLQTVYVFLTVIYFTIDLFFFGSALEVHGRGFKDLNPQDACQTILRFYYYTVTAIGRLVQFGQASPLHPPP